MIRRIALLTGEDGVPGMNAAIRSITRTALAHDWEVMGVRDGFAGLLSGDFKALTARSVGGIIQRGGTMLGGSCGERLATEAARQSALRSLAERDIDALVVIGSDAAQQDAQALAQAGFPVNGVACTIENDMAGSDITLGVDTALNIALRTIDYLKITTSSDCYAFLVEVAGHKSGYLALMTAIAGGAEAVVIPEVETPPERIAEVIRVSYEYGKSHAVIVVAEGAAYNVRKLVRHFGVDEPLGRGLRETTLCQVQQGGAPSAYDRLLGTRLGACAVEALARGEYGVLAGSFQGEPRTTPFAEVVGRTNQIDRELLYLADILGT